jgi:hypothetical protein
LDFCVTAPVAFAPHKGRQCHRQLISWDVQVNPANTKQDPFDWEMITEGAIEDFNAFPEPVEPLQAHPFSSSSADVKPLSGDIPPTPTLPSFRDLQYDTSSPWEPAALDLYGTPKLQDPSPTNKLDNKVVHLFPDYFTSTELVVEKELLDTFDLGHQVIPNMSTECASAGNDFFARDSSRYVDDLMDLASNVGIDDAPLSMAPLSSVPEPEAVVFPVTASYQPPPTPIPSMVWLSTSVMVNENIFPRKLYRLLEDCESNPNYRCIVSWSDDGTCFSVNCKQQFVEFILPNYFDQTQYASFRRQLNMYDFVRQGNASTYYNPYFIKNRIDLLILVQRKAGIPNKGK